MAQAGDSRVPVTGAFINLGALNVPVALGGIAILKATLVMLFGLRLSDYLSRG